jgi:hypothetical protein
MSKIPGGVALVLQELRNKVEGQSNKYRSTIPFSVVLGPEGTPEAQRLDKLKLSTEGDFLLTHITAKVWASATEDGAPVDPATFGATGVHLGLSEDGWGRKITREPVALETIATPGYGVTIYQPFALEQILLAGSSLQLDFRNSKDVWHHVELSLHGWQFRGSFRDQVQAGA